MKKKEESMIYAIRLLALVVLCTQLFIVQSQAQNQSGKQVAQKRSDIEELKRPIFKFSS